MARIIVFLALLALLLFAGFTIFFAVKSAVNHVESRIVAATAQVEQ